MPICSEDMHFLHHCTERYGTRGPDIKRRYGVALASGLRHDGPNANPILGNIRVTEFSIDPAIFRQVLGSYPTGVSVVTALDSEGNPAGMVVGSFTSVSLDPPLVGFLPDKRSTSWPAIEQAGRFCVNVLGSDQIAVCRQMAAKGTEKFAGLDIVLSEHGLPILPDAIARIECTIHSVTEAGDHYFVLGNVLHMETSRDNDPMLFHRGRYGGFAELS